MGREGEGVVDEVAAVRVDEPPDELSLWGRRGVGVWG